MAIQGNLVQIKNYATPDLRDVIFYEEMTEATFNQGCYELCKTAHPCEEGFKLVYIGQTNKQKRRLYYAADRQDQWKYNYTFKGTSALGGSAYEYYQRLEVIPRCDWIVDSTQEQYCAGAADPDAGKELECCTEEGGDPFIPIPAGEHVLVNVEQARSNIKELDACYVFVVKTYAKLCTLTTVKWDPELEEMVPSTVELCPAKDVTLPTTPEGEDLNCIDEDGNITEFDHINCDWYRKTTRRVIKDTEKAYQTYITYTWPAVLDGIEFMIWNKLDGQQFIFPRPLWKRRQQKLPTRAIVTRNYYNKPQDINDPNLFPIPQVMIPETITYVCPSVRISTPAALHPDITLVCNYGNNNPVWNFSTGSDRLFPVTKLNTPESGGTSCEEAPDWPASLIVDVQQKPYKGGYVVDIIEIFNPIYCT